MVKIDKIIAEREAKIKEKEDKMKDFDEELFCMYKDLEYFKDLKDKNERDKSV